MLSRPAILFAALGIGGLLLPLVQLKPNRIAAGQGIPLVFAYGGAGLVALGLGAVLIAGCLHRWPAWARVAAAALSIPAVILSLGIAARALSASGGSLARVSPASGFWLLLLAFCLMLSDAISRLRPGLALRGLLLLSVVLFGVGVLVSGLLDDVSVLREYAARRDSFRAAALAHLVLAFGSLGLALLIGWPLAVLIHHSPRARAPVLTVLNVVQTIPSLALFGLMMPLLAWLVAAFPGLRALGVSGIGMFPALAALFLYALLPVVSNTLAGFAGVPAQVRQAAAGLGMTRAQLLRQILVPLGLPALLAAVRIVLVQNIGLAVIAGLIGGGGFGIFVFQGLAQTAMDLVLLGTLPTIALALLAGAAMDLLVDLSLRKEPPP